MTAIDASLPKKERILIAAEDVFSRRGYTKATLDEIIALADTGKGTLYKYFGNKDNLFYTLIEEKHSHLMDELHSLTAQQPDIRGKLQAYLNCMLKFLRTNKGLWLIVWYELNAAHQGIHPDFDENGNWILTSLYGDPLPKPEEERLLRYYKILWEEVYVLAAILQDGQESGYLKYTPSQQIFTVPDPTSKLTSEAIFGAYHLFAGIANGVFHVINSTMDNTELTSIIVDYFLNGHAAKAK